MRNWERDASGGLPFVRHVRPKHDRAVLHVQPFAVGCGDAGAAAYLLHRHRCDLLCCVRGRHSLHGVQPRPRRCVAQLPGGGDGRIAPHLIASHHTAPHCIASHHITSSHVTSHRIAPHFITLHRSAPHCIILHCIALHFIASHHITSNHVKSHLRCRRRFRRSALQTLLAAGDACDVM